MRTDPAGSEACRLLCAGAYLDDAFRDRVIEELYYREERLIAPSVGFDATRVLAHALRSRRREIGCAALILVLWILAVPLTQGLIVPLMVPAVALAIAAYMRAGVKGNARLVASLVGWYGRLSMLAAVLVLLGIAFGADGGLLSLGGLTPMLLFAAPAIDPSGLLGYPGPVRAWLALAIPLVTAWLVGAQRGQFAALMAGELSPSRFADRAADPAESAPGTRFQRIRERIRREQHAPLVMYRFGNPFCGAGDPYKPWSLSVELRPREGCEPEPLDNGAVLRRIRPLVAALRVPSPQGSPQAAQTVRDRLRALEIDECVFLPVYGLPSRDAAPFGAAVLEAHRAAAVEEGGETRRHFLRIRVGGWGEELCVTVFVRVHTQGGMLMLEVVPHILWPLRPLFENADRIAYWYANSSAVGKALWALTHTPASLGASVATLWRSARSLWTNVIARNRDVLPDGPAVAVRELGSAGDPALFPTMDAVRYLKSIQDRVASGVRLALYDAGWQTAEFEQQIINVSSGGVFIGSAQDSAVSIGENNTTTNAPRSGGQA